MQKLPVFETARNAYAFLGRELGTILRLTWFPVLLITLVQYFSQRETYSLMRSVVGKSSAEIAIALVMNTYVLSFFLPIIDGLILMIGTAVMAVALHRVILFGDRRPGRAVHFSVGRIELRFMLVPLALFLGVFLSVAAFMAFAAGFATLIGLFALAPVILIVLAFAYLWIRVALIFPVTVVEGGYNFEQAWILTRGNFWRLAGLWLVVMLPVMLAFFASQHLLLPELRQGVATGNGPADMIAMLDTMLSSLPQMSVLMFLFLIIWGALGVAILSYSYKALNGLAPDHVLSPKP